MNQVLKLLLEGESLSTEQMAVILSCDKAAIEAQLAALKADNVLLGWRPVLHPNASGPNTVRAIIEVKVTPEREGGFDRMAERISRFAEVETCYLMSGSYDLLVIVKGSNLHTVANFVSARLATIGGVLSTATHFMLRAYKEQGFLLEREVRDPDKPSISP
ncbi:MAG: Lrp/AsnC family transcriptional regulator [Verrucomicrobiota bacterium]|nr:Lrp/AsnC family transcriptional regulator [Verrucomicrobiota bacterium]